ncbi:hypothetical protein KW800_02020 [Candidatus Parcubacteria bacterium]|nr:hypothetical protein [Candidatus Parcubacteria bacterium]
MDLHPIVIHFPIALLTLYAIFELVRFERVLAKPYWHYVKKVLVLAGFAGSLVAALTGLITANFTIVGPRIFMMHEFFALATILLSGIASGFYFKNNQHRALIVIAILILICITITGGLGAAMVRGTHFDPFMAPIFKLLGVY